MERIPLNEGRIIETEELLSTIRANGLKDPETMRMVQEWTAWQQELVDRVNTSQATMMFNILRADVYLAAGDVGGAWECLEEARFQAQQEGEDTLYKMIMQKMDKIESGV
jgi:hypothetical protein